MKPTIIAIISFLTLATCNPSRNQNPNCRFLLDIGINEEVNLTLVPGNELSPGTSVLVESALHRGIIVTQVGYDYYAWDAADPNHPFDGSCKLIPNSFTATCSCDDKNQYNLVTGLPENNGALQCSLIFYRVEKSGDRLFISN